MFRKERKRSHRTRDAIGGPGGPGPSSGFESKIQGGTMHGKKKRTSALGIDSQLEERR